MSGKVAEIRNLLSPEGLASSIVEMWMNFSSQRDAWVNEQKEKRNYIFATDTRTTSNSKLPWKNSTTRPKITQIRDNLHANYMAALFPNDDWLRWEGYTIDDEDIQKKVAIQAYMSNKTRESDFRATVSDLVYDYIDHGNVFCDTIYVNESYIDDDTGEVIQGYVGPKLVRISPYDIVFNPTAASFEDSPKITRSIRAVAELLQDAEEQPDMWDIGEALKKRDDIAKKVGQYSIDDFHKATGYIVDGFGSMQQYYESNYVEVLEIEGNFVDPDTGDYLKNYIITVIDRTSVIRKKQRPNWTGKGTKLHIGWRKRPDNLYAMGPLDNLVGMQYRIDHLENMQADAMDLSVFPPLAIIGEVEEFDWGPGAKIHIDEGGSIQELGLNLSGVMAANQNIQQLEQSMEEYAGAPKQAMGIRTPGEKTAFEVGELQNAASRIFTNKATNFEIMLEKALNNMLELARRNLDVMDVVRVMDDDLGVASFLSITKEDITARGKIRPIGARHFAAQAQLVQNLVGIMNSSVGQTIAPHISSVNLAKMVEDVLGLSRFDLVSTNVAIHEQAETQRVINQSQEDVEVEASIPEA